VPKSTEFAKIIAKFIKNGGKVALTSGILLKFFEIALVTIFATV